MEQQNEPRKPTHAGVLIFGGVTLLAVVGTTVFLTSTFKLNHIQMGSLLAAKDFILIALLTFVFELRRNVRPVRTAVLNAVLTGAVVAVGAFILWGCF